MPLIFPSFDPWTCESWLWEKQCHILHSDSEHTQPPGELCHSPAKYCHLTDTVTESLKVSSTIISSQVVPNGGKRGKTSELQEYGPIAPLVFAVRWIPWSETRLCGIPLQTWHSVSPQIVNGGKFTGCRKIRSTKKSLPQQKLYSIINLLYQAPGWPSVRKGTMLRVSAAVLLDTQHGL